LESLTEGHPFLIVIDRQSAAIEFVQILTRVLLQWCTSLADRGESRTQIAWAPLAKDDRRLQALGERSLFRARLFNVYNDLERTDDTEHHEIPASCTGFVQALARRHRAETRVESPVPQPSGYGA
jgi:hypothetical protein